MEINEFQQVKKDIGTLLKQIYFLYEGVDPLYCPDWNSIETIATKYGCEENTRKKELEELIEKLEKCMKKEGEILNKYKEELSNL